MKQTQQVIPAIDRLLRVTEILPLVGFGRTSLYNKVADGTFPAPVKIGLRASRWRLSAITAWLADPK